MTKVVILDTVPSFKKKVEGEKRKIKYYQRVKKDSTGNRWLTHAVWPAFTIKVDVIHLYSNSFFKEVVYHNNKINLSNDNF